MPAMMRPDRVVTGESGREAGILMMGGVDVTGTVVTGAS